MPAITPQVDPRMLNTGIISIKTKINGVDTVFSLPDPMEMQSVEHDIVTDESGRNELAQMVNMYVDKKWDHSITYRMIDPGTAAYIGQAIDNGDLINGMKQFKATIYNAVTGEQEEKTYYASDRTFKYQQWMPAGVAHPDPKLFAEVSFTLIEV